MAKQLQLHQQHEHLQYHWQQRKPQQCEAVETATTRRPYGYGYRGLQRPNEVSRMRTQLTRSSRSSRPILLGIER